MSFLTGTVNAISSSDFTNVLNTLQQQLSVATVVEVLAVAAGVAVGFAFMWWGVRKLTGVIMNAFKKGKVKL